MIVDLIPPVAARYHSSMPRPWILLLAIVWLVPAIGVAQSRKKITFDVDDEAASEDFEIVGKVHKPEVGYIITRQEQEDLETLQLRESFIPKIVDSVKLQAF